MRGRGAGTCWGGWLCWLVFSRQSAAGAELLNRDGVGGCCSVSCCSVSCWLAALISVTRPSACLSDFTVCKLVKHLLIDGSMIHSYTAFRPKGRYLSHGA